VTFFPLKRLRDMHDKSGFSRQGQGAAPESARNLGQMSPAEADRYERDTPPVTLFGLDASHRTEQQTDGGE